MTPNVPEEIIDILDGPEQECYSAYTAKMYPDNGDFYVTNPTHGGKITCHTCDGFIKEKDSVGYWSFQHRDEFPHVHFHKECFNEYEHYYGLDKPID